MISKVRIVGQGIAGTLLAWACDRRGIEWEIVDQGHAEAASRVGAGLVSPLTGMRLVPTWRFAEWAEAAQQTYRELEREVGGTLVRPLRLRRLFRNEKQRERMEARLDVPEVAKWVESADAEGVWLRGAYQVDTARLIAAMREKWRKQGRLREGNFAPDEAEDGTPTIWCVGAAVRDCWPRTVSWELSKGELLTGRIPGIEDDVVRNDGEWVLPLGEGRVRVGATFNRDDLSLASTAEAETQLRAAAVRLGGGGEIQDGFMDTGLRVNVPDRRPVVGWADDQRRRGIFAGLAAKGALWAPILAEQWAADGLRGERLESEVSAIRFRK